jgi:xylan 1,4-beta-xylosidase
MLYPDGRFKDHWRKGNSVPDVSRLETKLYFYFLGASYINVGCEAIHLGQTELMNGNDRDLVHYAGLLDLIRKHAKQHARRRMVLLDSHVPSGGLVRDGHLLMDFHSFPLRIMETPDTPQHAILKMGFSDGIYGRSMGGMTFSGWACENLPYLVEIDNWGVSRQPGQPNAGSIWVWGYDEITWFAHQDRDYRGDWLRYARDWVRRTDPNGYLQMPGSRTLRSPRDDLRWYYANNRSAAVPQGFGDEAAIRDIWAENVRRASETSSFPVSIQVDASTSSGVLRPIWRFFGADEPNYAYMKHGRKLLSELGALTPEHVYFRAHNLLTSGDGTPALKWGSTGVYQQDESGRPVFDWTILDRIFDTYLEHGVHPYTEMGFMPRALSIRPEPYQHQWTPAAKYDEIYTGWAYPPNDYDKWAELIFQWVRHCVERYGREEVESWYWQTWNEPNIGYWRGTAEEFHKLHDYAIDAVRRALPSARVGGPDVAGSGGSFTRDFLEHCLRGTNYATGEKGTPLDFVAFHAKGRPTYVDGHVRMGIAHHLRTIDDGFRIVASFPELNDTPVIIGESDPEGCAACQGPQLAYRNGTMYSSYTAASFPRKLDLAERHGINFEGALTWAFEFEDQPYFAGFRSLASNGIDKPVLNVFRMFSKMSGQRVAVDSDGAVPLERILKEGIRDQSDVSALASVQDGRLFILLWHYHDDDLPGPAAAIDLRLTGLAKDSGETEVRHFRIDQEHSNAFTLWQSMGSPQSPTAEQYAALEAAGQLAELAATTIPIHDGAGRIPLALPRQAVSLLILE